ncbi:hypothetical protein [Polaribacter sp.]|uniref:hypothetical protein n=1 Tax=Polaribacter sp. TaxID=1920175 RepID=UPI003EF4E57E
MIVEKKENYFLISSDENVFKDFYNSFLKIEKEYELVHVVLQISDNMSYTKEDVLLFLNLSNKKKELATSFVLIQTLLDVDDFPETLTIVPTLQEAEDVLEMEAMERELGF